MPVLGVTPGGPVDLALVGAGLTVVDEVDVRALVGGVLELRLGLLDDEAQLEPVPLLRSDCEGVPVDPLRLGIGQGAVVGGEVDCFPGVERVFSE